jgi:hypothetical protein
MLMAIVGVGILISVGFLIFNSISKKPQVTEIEFSEADIVYGEPLHAIHEMGGAALSDIPFFPENEPQPQIAVSETTHNFGVVGATEVVSYDFVIKNVGQAPLTISRAYTTCGCTTADFTATVIPPGKVVIMTLVFDAGFHDLSGQTVRRGVIVESNDPNVPQLELWASVSVAKN